jgi:hypothetical protein
MDHILYDYHFSSRAVTMIHNSTTYFHFLAHNHVSVDRKLNTDKYGAKIL